MSSIRPVRLLVLLGTALVGTGLIATAALARSPQHAGSASAGSALVWRGDVTTARAVANDVAKAWQKSGHGHVEVQSFNTASGLDAVASGAADIAGSARGSNGSAAEQALTFTPVGWDGLVMITHPSNPVSNLTLQQLHDIYYGKIHNWSELGGRSAPINVYAVASPGDGVEFSLRRLLFGRGNQPVAAPRLYVNTAKLEEAVTLDPKALGVTTLAGISGNRKVKALRIDGVAPTQSSVANGSYKLFTPLYLVTNPASPHATQAQAFVAFAGSDGAAALRQHGVLPYQNGTALASMDSSRRAQILAEVGARAVREPTPSAPAIAAPGATYASQAAIAPTSERTLQARQALAQRRAEQERARAAAAANDASLAGVTGEATTVDNAAAHGRDFTKVTGSAQVSTQTYTVARGDTLSSIAHAKRVSVADLRAWNRLKSDQVKVGQVLRIGR
jgi:phosphate transport system substrate-binding protein